MAPRAQVRSLEAIEAFRSNLVIYLSQARPALEEVSADVLRLRVWLENDQRLHWENEFRRRSKTLEQAQQALFSARLGTLQPDTAVAQMAVQRAKRAVEEAEDKLRLIKRWNREFDSRIQPLVKQTEKLHTLLSNDMVKALAYLAEAISTLAAYADLKAPAAEAVGLPGPAPEKPPESAPESAPKT